MKRPKEATVAPWMPLVMARVGSQALDDVLEDISLSAMVTESSLSSACLKTSDIVLAQKPCSADILLIYSINASLKIVDSTCSKRNRDEGREGNESNVLHGIFPRLVFYHVDFKGDFGTKLFSNSVKIFDSKTGSHLIAINCDDGWGAPFVKHVASETVKFTIIYDRRRLVEEADLLFSCNKKKSRDLIRIGVSEVFCWPVDPSRIDR
jgi:hypothetical protein